MFNSYSNFELIEFCILQELACRGTKGAKIKKEGEEEPVRLVKTSWCPILCEPYQVGKS